MIKRQNLKLARAIRLIITFVLFLGNYQMAIAQTVDIPDHTLRAVIKSALRKNVRDTITQADMASLKSINAVQSGIRTLRGLEFAVNLTELNLRRNRVSDLSPLKNLKNLTWLSLINNPISDISPLENLTNLTHLYIGWTNKKFSIFPLSNLTNLTHLFLANSQISDVSPLKNLKNLIFLDLELNSISDISPLSDLINLSSIDLDSNLISNATPLQNMIKLVYLDISDNKISDVNPFKDIVDLESLDLDTNRISDITPLKNLIKVKVLDLHGNKISDISPLKNMTKLIELDLDDNEISDISPLRDMINLTVLLDLDGNKITDISPLNNLVNLTELDLDNNTVSDISPLKNMINLIKLDLHNNQVFDLSPIANLINLTELDLDDNDISDISPLKNMKKLMILDLDGNKISDVTPLSKMTMLIELDLHDNKISDVTPLKDLTKLTILDLGQNHIKDFSPILRLTQNLKEYNYENQSITFTATSTPPEPDIRLPASRRVDIYWINTDSGTLHRLVGSSVEDIALGVQNVVSLVVTSNRLYWVEDTGNSSGRLRRSNLNGTNIQLIRDLTATPASITVDTANSKIYLTNAWGKVQSINLDGSGYAPNLITGLSDPTDIAVGSGKVYWITGGGTVHSANVDGSGVTQIAGGYETLGSIAVGGNKVFWTEITGDSESEGNIHSANLDGSNVRELVSVFAAPYSISIDMADNKLYWTNSRGKVLQSNLKGNSIKTVVRDLVSLGDVSVPSGTTAPRAPGTFSQYDVNRDGTVDNTDAALVAAALGESPPSDPNLDVNGDGMVNFLDLLLVFDNRDNTNAAPVALAQNLPNVSREEIQNQIEQLLASDNQSATAQFTLAYLQSLLEVVTPVQTRLLANYPNPFNPETWIPYQLATSSEVQITIYNSAGKEVRMLSLGHQSKGYYTDRSSAAYWDGRNVIGEAVSSGVYFYTLTTDRMSATRKMLILK